MQSNRLEASEPHLLPRQTPASAGVSSLAIDALLNRLAEKRVETHSLMVVRHGQVVAEGWWAPYSADRPHLLYSLTKSFTSMAVGLAIADGALQLDDRIVDVLPDHVPDHAPDQAHRLTVHHLLSMTTGHRVDTLAGAWQLEPGDLVKGFLRLPFVAPEGTEHFYDNSTTFVLARMVERATGRDLREYLDERLFAPMGIHDAEWDTVADGRAFGFHGLHLRTEAVAAFGELLLRGGRWRGEQLVPRDWVELATSRHIASRHYAEGEEGGDPTDFLAGYGYQIWRSRHGFHGNGAFGQHCVVVPASDLVIVVTSAQRTVQQAQDVLDAIWDCLLPGIDHPSVADDDEVLAERLKNLALQVPSGTAGPRAPVSAVLDGTVESSALPNGTPVTLEPTDDGWLVRFGALLDVAVGLGRWRETAPLGRPICASGGWQRDTFSADLYVIKTPHHLRLTIAEVSGAATLAWTTVPLTSSDLLVHVRDPLMTRPDVA